MTQASLSPRDTYVLHTAPTIMAALVTRQLTIDANAAADQGMDVAGRIWDIAGTEPSPLRSYLLDHLPHVLAGFITRQINGSAHELLRPSLTATSRLYELVAGGTPYLLDCPFCGQKAGLRVYTEARVEPLYAVSCSSDSCHVRPQTSATNEREAAAQWNRRLR